MSGAAGRVFDLETLEGHEGRRVVFVSQIAKGRRPDAELPLRVPAPRVRAAVRGDLATPTSVVVAPSEQSE